MLANCHTHVDLAKSNLNPCFSELAVIPKTELGHDIVYLVTFGPDAFKICHAK